MRTTLTIDDDVTAQLKRLCRSRDVSLKELINDALRRGLKEMSAPPEKRKPFRTQTIRGVKPLLDNVDNITEVLAYAEGEDFK
jgi:hypothetical protein